LPRAIAAVAVHRRWIALAGSTWPKGEDLWGIASERCPLDGARRAVSLAAAGAFGGSPDPLTGFIGAGYGTASVGRSITLRAPVSPASRGARYGRRESVRHGTIRMRRVAIVGFAQTIHQRRKPRETQAEMLYPVLKELLGRMDLRPADIGFTVSGSSDFLDGKSFSFLMAFEVMGAWPPIAESHVEMDGAWAAYYAWLRLASGAADTALVAAYGKSSESSLPHVLNLLLDPFYVAPLGLDAVSAAALQARRYMDRFGITRAQAAAIAVKNRRHALQNPYAQIARESTVGEVLGSAPLTEPLHELDCAPITDGACAVLLAAEGAAERLCPRPAWIAGVDHRTSLQALGARELSEATSARQAATRAYAAAGVRAPRHEFDVAEITECFGFQELMLYEALGFCAAGEGGRLVDSGATAVGGELPVNPSGGALAANPIMATGLVRLGEAALQVMGEAGARQVPGVRRALAHAAFGHCLQGNMVWVLSA
jgi:acetyl-CoA acetyltransferase